MTLERNRHKEISFACDTPGCYEGISTLTDDFQEALVMLRLTRWTTEMKVDTRSKTGKSYEHFCQQCSDEISRIKEDAMDSLLAGVPKARTK